MSARVEGRATPTPARRRAAGAKKAAAPAVAPLLFTFARRAEPDAVARRPLFEIDGSEYTIPAVVETGHALALLGLMKRITEPLEQGTLLIQQLAGPAALKALLDEASFTPADWRALIDVLWEHAFGGLEEEIARGN